MRKYLRQIAKARLHAMGVGNVNRKMSLTGPDGVKNWRKALYGKTGEAAHRAQMNLGKLIDARKHPEKRPRRVLKKVTP